jgi:hypothetical protein
LIIVVARGQRHIQQRGIERLQQQRTALGGQLQLYDQRAVLIVEIAEPPLRVLPRLARDLFHFLHAAELPHHCFDVMRGAVQSDVEQSLLRRGCCDAGDRAHLRVAEFAATHGRGDQWQAFERAGDTDLLARRPQIEAALPAEPVGAGMRKAIGPALATVELGDQHQPAVVRRVEVPGQFGDLGLELADRQTALRSVLRSG